MSLSHDAIRQLLGAASARLQELEIFGEIESTNSYLMQRSGPPPGQVRVAATDNQTAGRGRHGRTWQSPPGSGLCLSLSYSFASQPRHLSALTLSVGLAVINALKEQKIEGVQLKWPNDLIAMDSKLGGILTEAQSRAGGAVSVVTGVGLNLDLSNHRGLELDRNQSRPVTDVKSHADFVPDINALASSVIRAVSQLLVDYETSGFEQFRDQWQQHDWLCGRALTVETAQRQMAGVGAGVADDGALLVDTPEGGLRRITSGTVLAGDMARVIS